MKRNILLAVCLLSQSITFAQVTESVDFNTYTSITDNDYIHRFHDFGPTGIIPIMDSGITGGCLRLPAQYPISSGSIYCSRYKDQVAATFVTSFCFRWDNSTINVPANVLESASLRLEAHSVANDQIIGFVHYDSTIHIYNINTNGGWDTSSTKCNFVAWHWYKMVLTTNTIGGPFGDQVGVSNQVYDLGVNGTSNPSLVNSIQATVSNIAYVQDTAIYIQVSGSAWGGCRYIDNFSYNGIKSADSCVPTGLVTTNKEGLDYTVYPNPSNGRISLDYHLPSGITNGVISVFNMNGQKVKSLPVTDKQHILTLEEGVITPGLYYCVLRVAGFPEVIRRITVLK